MKQFLSIAIVLSALFSTSAHAWFFFFLPGSVTGAVSDAVTGSEGENCVGPNAKVGDNIRLPNGDIKSIKSLSGTSVRCTNPTLPIRALLVSLTSTPTPAQQLSNENIKADREAAEKQQAEFARLDTLAADKAKAEAARAAEVQAKAEAEAAAKTQAEATSAAKTKADAEVAAKAQADAEATAEADRRVADDRQKGRSLEVKLKELKLLYTKGLISKDVYEARQRELLKAN